MLVITKVRSQTSLSSNKPPLKGDNWTVLSLELKRYSQNVRQGAMMSWQGYGLQKQAAWPLKTLVAQKAFRTVPRTSYKSLGFPMIMGISTQPCKTWSKKELDLIQLTYTINTEQGQGNLDNNGVITYPRHCFLPPWLIHTLSLSHLLSYILSHTILCLTTHSPLCKPSHAGLGMLSHKTLFISLSSTYEMLTSLTYLSPLYTASS